MAEFKFSMFFVWTAAMMLACWAFEVARMFARRMAKESARGRQAGGMEGGAAGTRPRVAVILPIKGVDEDTEKNIRALLLQEYPGFRLLFAVESAEDPVVPLLERMSCDAMREETGRPQKGPTSVETVVAGIATVRGQKIHNQLAAIERTTAEDEILVFMDADACPKPHWLGELAGPLNMPEVGATTGFRFYVPTRGDGGSPSVASAMASVINAGVAALLGPGWRNIAWGGSMAIRRADFFSFGVHEAWQHALSDDYVLSYCVKTKAKRRIEFVTACLVASTANLEWASFWEFAARQYRITKICALGVWLTAIGAALLYLTGLIYTLTFWVLSLFGLGRTPAGGADHLLLLMFAALYTANVLRGGLLLRGGLAALPDEAGKIKRVWFWYTFGYPFSLAVNLWALARSAFGRTINWRGVRYRMHSRLETTVSPRPPVSSPAPRQPWPAA